MVAFVPMIVSAIGGAALQIAGSFALRILTSLGVGIVTYSGTNAAIGWLKTQAVGYFQGLGADVLGMLSTMKVGVCISMIFSAMVARMVVSGMTSDTVKRWVIK